MKQKKNRTHLTFFDEPTVEQIIERENWMTSTVPNHLCRASQSMTVHSEVDQPYLSYPLDQLTPVRAVNHTFTTNSRYSRLYTHHGITMRSVVRAYLRFSIVCRSVGDAAFIGECQHQVAMMTRQQMDDFAALQPDHQRWSMPYLRGVEFSNTFDIKFSTSKESIAVLFKLAFV